MEFLQKKHSKESRLFSSKNSMLSCFLVYNFLFIYIYIYIYIYRLIPGEIHPLQNQKNLPVKKPNPMN